MSLLAESRFSKYHDDIARTLKVGDYVRYHRGSDWELVWGIVERPAILRRNRLGGMQWQIAIKGEPGWVSGCRLTFGHPIEMRGYNTR